MTEQRTSVGYKPITKPVKSRAGERVVPLADDTVNVLRANPARRNAWKLVSGSDWPDTGNFFLRPDGQPWHPETITQRFDNLVAASDLPPVRLHDLRHIAATLMLAAGASIKEIQDTLGPRLLHHDRRHLHLGAEEGNRGGHHQADPPSTAQGGITTWELPRRERGRGSAGARRAWR
ncbi:tyrosine-type recombinase/integrase [Micromonospora sp. NPDC005087]|uniref:tyrosine-type recombinase/integrase n=1 Tax=Micromonospora sp. NPDC005087 TaxID=3364225 RepID=UPI00368B9209